MKPHPMPPRLTTLVAAALLGACAVPASGIRATDGATVTLAIGQTARLGNGGGLRYVRLINDSRCRPDVQCVWAGDAVIALDWTPANDTPRALQLHFNAAAGPNHADLDGRRVTFTALSRQGARASLLVTLVP